MTQRPRMNHEKNEQMNDYDVDNDKLSSGNQERNRHTQREKKNTS